MANEKPTSLYGSHVFFKSQATDRICFDEWFWQEGIYFNIGTSWSKAIEKFTIICFWYIRFVSVPIFVRDSPASALFSIISKFCQNILSNHDFWPFGGRFVSVCMKKVARTTILQIPGKEGKSYIQHSCTFEPIRCLIQRLNQQVKVQKVHCRPKASASPFSITESIRKCLKLPSFSHKLSSRTFSSIFLSFIFDSDQLC